MSIRVAVLRKYGLLFPLIISITLAQGCGTRPKPPTQPPVERQPSPGLPTEPIRRTMIVRATAYNSVPAQTSGHPAEAAWGDTLRPGMRAIAVSPDLLATGLTRGTRVRIHGLRGEYVVLDKTAGRMSRHIDIYMGKNIRRARNWGVRKVQISWLQPPGKQ